MKRIIVKILTSLRWFSGLGRPLKKDKDFQRSLGEEVEIPDIPPDRPAKEFVRGNSGGV